MYYHQRKGNLQFEFLPLKPKRELQEIKGSYMELTMKSFYETLNTQNYFHITLTDEEDIFDAIGKLRTIYPNIMRLDYDNKRTQLHQTITIDETVEKQSPFEQLETFYELQNNQPLSSKQVQYCQAIMEELWENQK